MADLTVRQKYPLPDEPQANPKSLRLDHANWGDVHRTVYAKGVITDFEKVKKPDGSDQVDPIQVKSRVKVKIGDGEETEDFIPVFFHPKALYWDGPDEIKATDFNEEGKYFEKAWQSFRCGDEVIVLLQAPTDGAELKPVAVLGFADGVPRIGENIFKLEYQVITSGGEAVTWFGSWPYVFPDDWTLITDIETPQTSTESFRYFQILYNTYEEVYYGDRDEERLGPDGINLRLDKIIEPTITNTTIETIEDSGVGTVGCQSCPEGGVNFGSTNPQIWSVVCIDERSYIRFLIPVGAILLMVECIGRNIDYRCEFYMEGPPPVPEALNVRARNGVGYTAIVSAGVYTEELFNLASTQNTKTIQQRWVIYDANGSWGEAIDGLVRQSVEDYIDAPGGNWIDWKNVVFKVRPHTKEELIAAEMWPKEE